MKIILWALFWILVFSVAIVVLCIAKSSGDYNRERERHEELKRLNEKIDREKYADEHFGCSED